MDRVCSIQHIVQQPGLSAADLDLLARLELAESDYKPPTEPGMDFAHQVEIDHHRAIGAEEALRLHQALEFAKRFSHAEAPPAQPRVHIVTFRDEVKNLARACQHNVLAIVQCEALRVRLRAAAQLANEFLE